MKEDLRLIDEIDTDFLTKLQEWNRQIIKGELDGTRVISADGTVVNPA